MGEGSVKYILTHTIVVNTPSPTIYSDNAASLGGEGDTIVTTSQLDAIPTALVSTNHSFKGDKESMEAAVDERANVAIDAIKSVARDPSGQGGILEFFVIASVLARECERRAVAGEDVRSTYIVAALAR